VFIGLKNFCHEQKTESVERNGDSACSVFSSRLRAVRGALFSDRHCVQRQIRGSGVRGSQLAFLTNPTKFRIGATAMTSRTVSNHVLEIIVNIKKTRTLSDEEAVRVSVELHRIVEAVRHGCDVIRNPGSGPDHAVVDAFLKSLRREDIIADPGPIFHSEIRGGHEAHPRSS